MRFRLDASVAPGEGRVSEVEVATAGGWEPVDESATYRIVTNDFMAGGGDGYTMFEEDGQEVYDTAIDMAEALAEYLSANAPYSPAIEGRIVQ
jgi:5'-nucleotidase / UDP-sugar diphosphatase